MPARIPVALNSFGLWLALMIGLTVVNYGYPIVQLMALKETSVPAVYVGAGAMSEQPLFSFRNPWFGASVGVTAAIAVLAALAGLIWLPLAQPDLKLSGIWDAICSAAGVPRAASQGPAGPARFQDLECRDDVGDADAAEIRFRSDAARRWRSAARSATGRKA